MREITINHAKRKSLGLTSYEYMILVAINKLKSFTTVLDVLGEYPSKAHEALLRLKSKGYVSGDHDLHETIDLFEDDTLTKDVCEYFNLRTGSKYRVETFERLIKSIVKAYPEASLDQFKSIIEHKYDQWGSDPRMEQYLRPMTLFGSIVKFANYLDDATNYWIKQAKHGERTNY
jgi:hypothetical protein